MRLWTTLLLIGGGVAAYRRVRSTRTVARDDVDTTTAPAASTLRDVATGSGIASVDPEPLSQVVEAQDPDATSAAHTELRDLHDRLPR